MSPGTPLLALALALCAAPAPGSELWKSSSGDLLVEGTAFYKPYLSWLRLEPGLVEGTRALQEAARARLPPELARALPKSAPLSEHVGLSTHSVRLGGSGGWREQLKLSLAWQATAVIASSPAFAGVSASTGALGAALVTAQRRLVDFSPWLVDAPGLRLQHNLDALALEYHHRRVTVVLGRQVLSWGTGRLWNPTDVLSPFAPTDVDREIRRGFDALRVSVGLDGGGPFGVDEGFVRLVVGGSWRPHEQWVLTGEYYFNGFGAKTADQLVPKLTHERVVRGELFGAGRHCLGLATSWLATELASLSVTTLVNLTDPSALLAPALELWFEQRVLVRAGGFVPLGAGPDPAGARAVTADDVLGRTARWETASRALGARSEYGLSPFGVFAQVGLHWQ